MQRSLRLDDLDVTRVRDLDATSEHLQTLSELSDVQEKYYRLGAEMRLLKQNHLHATALRDELHHVRLLLQASQAREAQLAERLDAANQELAGCHAKATALKTVVAEPPTRREAWSEREMETFVLELKRELQVRDAELRAKDETALHYETLYMDLQAHCERLDTSVAALRLQVREAQVQAPSTAAMGQLVCDNQRLVALLIDTKEFGHFKFYTSLENASFVAPDSFGPPGVAPSSGAPQKDDILAWGRLVHELSEVYPRSPESPPIHVATEEKQWVPTKVLSILSTFRAEYAPSVPPHAFARMAKAINAAWHKACAAKLAQLRDAMTQETSALRRRVKHAVPYEAVVHVREIHRLKTELAQLIHEKLRASKGDISRMKPERRCHCSSLA
ncbi:hypothetical protein SPRG_03188 [Saprolegnia parasitica CBS 223.65]|uniref:Uncharacterized protein n=1 Tax=Saprolegnia parasitica (strain CBS 223.65) TaxID=695850 RepID=A0A067CYT7_SAPPC|nr:hypothetical protein SPRG_03188 [Saprolegnia parasitica CBS 223.65]KDO31972.1 hypothetical protein SPRG_03188 [Saprolegnia parasitica CBS 223.65]|eukprot:XP_012197168.1 hypothetical protein SPRG_03188 [Saprolegnia parasitica CBS 223.65]